MFLFCRWKRRSFQFRISSSATKVAVKTTRSPRDKDILLKYHLYSSRTDKQGLAFFTEVLAWAWAGLVIAVLQNTIQATDAATLTAGDSTGCCSITCQQMQTLPMLPTRYFHCFCTVWWFEWYLFSNPHMQTALVPLQVSGSLQLLVITTTAAAHGQGWAWELPCEELSSCSSSSKGLT